MPIPYTYVPLDAYSLLSKKFRIIQTNLDNIFRFVIYYAHARKAIFKKF